MKNITALIDKTPFKTRTYQFLATQKKSEHPGVFYTPYTITNWHFDNGPRSFTSFNNSLHDICHIIDLYQSGLEHRLLLPDFGWELQSDRKLPNKYFMREMQVITMQSFLSTRIFGRGSTCKSKEIKKIYRSRTIDPFLPGKQWDRVVDYKMNLHADIGVVNYLKLWKAACEYVRKNRI